MIKRFLPLAFLALSACAASPLTEFPSRAVAPELNLPPTKSFAKAPKPAKILEANADLTRDFLELSFEMESGKPINIFSRFEQPITLAFATQPSPLFQADLSLLLSRFRNEAGLNIRQTKTGQDANIVIQTLPRRVLRKTVPQAACFVVPRVKNWAEFRQNRRTGKLDWSTLKIRERATVFIPDDIAPQEARDCLHEEIAQSLGPLNDVYRLPKTIFNDDNLVSVLGSFDMLMLKIYYSGELKSGMSRAQVASLLPPILKRLHPEGETLARDGEKPTPRSWIDAIIIATGPGTSKARRLSNAAKAVAIARNKNWQDNRLGFSLFAQGRLALGLEPDLAVESFARAYTTYASLYGTDDIHTAQVALQLAAFALSSGDSQSALKLINQSLPAAQRSQNASLLATLLMIKAEALDFEGRRAEAATVRMDSLGWARYGFGTTNKIRARLREIAALRAADKKPEA
ncbi:MAG: DUF2927 domain-containing protein [Alphaproteobacteria bacterium]|nr:DUF2927 domain-containing protein [Alphaproteobacteria bacterium]